LTGRIGSAAPIAIKAKQKNPNNSTPSRNGANHSPWPAYLPDGKLAYSSQRPRAAPTTIAYRIFASSAGFAETAVGGGISDHPLQYDQRYPDREPGRAPADLLPDEYLAECSIPPIPPLVYRRKLKTELSSSEIGFYRSHSSGSY
jgi:hypothetical protein